VRTLADLPLVPLTTKEDLKGLPRESRVVEGTNVDRLVRRRTSGSTGIPLSIFRSAAEERLLGIYRFRALREIGLRINDRRVSLEVFHDGRGGKGIVPGWMQKLGLLPRRRINSLEPPEVALATLGSTRADVVGGYASFLHLLSGMAGPGGLAGVGARIVTSSGEVLTRDMRHRIRGCFGAPVVDTYSSLEFNLIGFECAETGNLHLLDHSVIAEVIRNGRTAEPGERGELVVTALHSRTSPFIRYRLGDIVTKGPKPCPCGLPFGTIRAVEGRMNDLFPLPDGRTIHPVPLKVALNEGARWACEYRIVQEARDRIVTWVVPRREPSAEEVAAARRALGEILGPGVAVEIRLVTDLPRDPSGKARGAFSRVQSIYEGIDWDALHRSWTPMQRRPVDLSRPSPRSPS